MIILIPFENIISSRNIVSTLISEINLKLKHEMNGLIRFLLLYFLARKIKNNKSYIIDEEFDGIYNILNYEIDISFAHDCYVIVQILKRK